MSSVSAVAVETLNLVTRFTTMLCSSSPIGRKRSATGWCLLTGPLRSTGSTKTHSLIFMLRDRGSGSLLKCLDCSCVFGKRIGVVAIAHLRRASYSLRASAGLLLGRPSLAGPSAFLTMVEAGTGSKPGRAVGCSLIGGRYSYRRVLTQRCDDPSRAGVRWRNAEAL